MNKSSAFFGVACMLSVLLLWVAPAARAQQQELSTQDVEEYKKEARQMVSFLEYMMNVLGSPKATAQEKETVITQSYKKAFKDDKVQIEDDLDEDRRVVTNKNIQAYLKDINFFFKQAKFELNVNDVSHYVTSDGRIFFRVTVNRNLQGVTLEGDTVNANQLRYVEINLNETEKALKIASIYTTKLSEKEELANWWTEVPEGWRQFFLEQIGAQQADSATFRMLREIVKLNKVVVSGRKNVYELEPLAKLTDLKYLDISGTNVTSLVPLRNLTKLETLICSDTQVGELEALKYSANLRELICERTLIRDLSILTNFSRLEKLHCEGTPIYELKPLTGLKDLRCAKTAITSLAPVAQMPNLLILDCAQTSVSDLKPLAKATKLNWLSIEETPVADLSPLSQLTALNTLVCNSTPVQDLDPLSGLPTLEKVYCDKTPVTQQQANRFMAVNPGILIIFETGQLQSWWEGLDPGWQQIFGQYVDVKTLSKEKLAQIVNLTEIDITGKTSVRDLSALSRLNHLKTLKCANTGISSLEPLSGLSALQYLDCSGTAVDSLSPLEGARNLQTLMIDNTQVRSLNALREVSGINKLSCEHTPLSDERILQFIRQHPECVVIFKSDKLGLWWNGLSAAWKEVLTRKVSISGVPTQEQLHEIAFIKELVV